MFNLIFSAFVALATIAYAFLTLSLVRETRRMRRAQTDAKMSISLEVSDRWINLINLVVRNEGVGPAYNVKFEVTPVRSEGCNVSILEFINKLGFIRKGIDYFSPGQEIKTFFTSMTTDFESKIKTSLYASISYSTASGEIINDKYLLDLSIFIGIHQMGTPPLYKISQSLESIKSNVDYLVSGFKKLQVVAYSREEILSEQAEWEEEIKKNKESASEQREPSV